MFLKNRKQILPFSKAWKSYLPHKKPTPERIPELQPVLHRPGSLSAWLTCASFETYVAALAAVGRIFVSQGVRQPRRSSPSSPAAWKPLPGGALGKYRGVRDVTPRGAGCKTPWGEGCNTTAALHATAVGPSLWF